MRQEMSKLIAQVALCENEFADTPDLDHCLTE